VDTRASVLPPGRRRLLEIARLIAFQPRIVLMDEPAAGLTHAEIEHLETMIAAFAAAGIGVVLVEHHVDLVLRLATRVTVLDFGKVLASGTPEEIRNDPKVLEAYLGTSLQANEGDR
jgi:ABC-type branched-subunit amino acid transport system ATPase component